jgi:tetratricopeptide (TPR) repeat protein
MMQGIAVWMLFQWLLVWVGAPPENYYNAANRAFAAGELHRAEILYSRVWQKPAWAQALFCSQANPAPTLKFKALYNAGNAAYLQQHWRPAVLAYEAALRLDPGDEDAWYNLGLAQARLQGKAPAPEGISTPSARHPAQETTVPADIFSLPPAALADYIQDLTQAGYPFRPGSSLKPAVKTKQQSDEVDW